MASLSRRIAGLASFVDTSVHYIDAFANNESITSGGSIELCNGTARGTSHFNRLGNVERMKALFIRLNVSVPAGFAGPAFLRIMILLDKRPNGVAPTFGDVLLNDAVDAAIVSPLDLKSGNQFKILRNRIFSITEFDKGAQVMTFFKKMNLKVMHNTVDNDPAVTNIETNGLFLMMISDQGLPANQPIVTWQIRYRFVG